MDKVTWLSAWVTAVSLGCASAPSPQPEPAAPVGGPIVVPHAPAVRPLPRRVVARGLNNPRGMFPLPDGGLLVSEAGTGDPAAPNSGGLLRIVDRNADGDFDDPDERQAVLSEQPSKNIFHVVRRDEVFGMAGIAEGEGVVLAALAFFGGPSTIFRVDGQDVSTWGSTQGNINDLTYDPSRKAWFAVASTTDEVVRLLEGGLSQRVLKFPTLPSGQDAVPGYIEDDPGTRELLVSLFSGSPEGEEGGDGTELVPRAGGIVAVDPDARDYHWVVAGLTVPTDLAVAKDGSLYVLEFCDAFVDPVNDRAAMQETPMHGGFRRFSGRLLHVDRERGEVTVVAEHLDHPTNLVLSDDALYIAEGMGTPGRPIPTAEGSRPLEGFISAIQLVRTSTAP